MFIPDLNWNLIVILSLWSQTFEIIKNKSQKSALEFDLKIHKIYGLKHIS